MALNFQSPYYATTTCHFCQVDYPAINTAASNRLNNLSYCDPDCTEWTNVQSTPIEMKIGRYQKSSGLKNRRSAVRI